MSTIRNPVGPQPPSVYWRRRLVALLALVAVIVVIVLIVSAIANSNNKATPGPTNTNSSKPSDQPNPNPSGTPSFPASGGTDCAAGQVQITAVTDSNSYKSGVKPMISMKVKNAGTAPCTFDVGTAAQEYIITSGTDRIWSSKDCQKNPEANAQVLQPGVELSTDPIPWDRTRSSTTTCNTSRPVVVANKSGPTYKLQVKLGTVESEPVAFRLF
jgi:hypothetical protein